MTDTAVPTNDLSQYEDPRVLRLHMDLLEAQATADKNADFAETLLEALSERSEVVQMIYDICQRSDQPEFADRAANILTSFKKFSDLCASVKLKRYRDLRKIQNGLIG